MTLLSSFVSISFCLLDRLSICLAVWLQPVGSSFRLLVGLSVNWSVCQLVCLSEVCFSVGLSVQPSGWLSVCQLVLSSVSLSFS